jgi:hypothetical protein
MYKVTRISTYRGSSEFFWNVAKLPKNKDIGSDAAMRALACVQNEQPRSPVANSGSVDNHGY